MRLCGFRFGSMSIPCDRSLCLAFLNPRTMERWFLRSCSFTASSSISSSAVNVRPNFAASEWPLLGVADLKVYLHVPPLLDPGRDAILFASGTCDFHVVVV